MLKCNSIINHIIKQRFKYDMGHGKDMDQETCMNPSQDVRRRFNKIAIKGFMLQVVCVLTKNP